ncbi:MAG: CAP domain-containing protein [Pirellulales bacterium]
MNAELRLIACFIITVSWFGFSSNARAQTREDTDVEKMTTEAGVSESPATPMPDASEQIVAATNQFREQQGLSPVEVDPNLQAAAKYFAKYMARTHTYGHTADGKRPSERAKQHGYDYCIVAENIAYAYSSLGYGPQELAQRFVTGWKESPKHRENMLDPDVTQTGVAVAQSGESGYYFAVQMFGRPESQRIEFRVVNRSGQELTYEIDDRKFPLGPRYVRTHQRCRPTTLVLASDQEDARKFEPKNGETLVIEQVEGEIQVRVE